MKVFTGATVIAGVGSKNINKWLWVTFFIRWICDWGLYTGQDWLLTVRIQSTPASGYCQTIAPAPVSRFRVITGGSCIQIDTHSNQSS